MRHRVLISVTAAAAAVTLVSAAYPASARISPAQTIDGPSADILEFGGAALAGDGSGGVVYRKRDGDGHSHIFAARFANGSWFAPQRVDVGQQFDSGFPRIAAGVGGRLLVVWTQELGPDSDRLFAASLDPGATRFEPPAAVDFDVGEATSTYPSVAMNAGGTAYVTYRVMDSDAAQSQPTGYLRAELRLARYRGSTWTVVGNLNRNAANPVRQPTAGNSPKVGVTVDGDAVLAFQEPDDGFVDRIWARRIFGTSPGIPLLVSPTVVNGVAMNGPADRFSLAVAGFGAAAVAYRQQPAAGGSLTAPQVFVNTMHERFTEDSLQFLGARPVGDADAAIGFPSAGIAPDGSFAAGYSSSSGQRYARGIDTDLLSVDRLGAGLPSPAGDPQTTLGANLAGAAAWPVASGEQDGVAIEERPSDSSRGARAALVSVPSSGGIPEMALAGSGLGDALIGFRQGGNSGGAIGAAFVDAPPSDFAVGVPLKWVKPSQARVTWDPAPDAIGGIRYAPMLDGRIERSGIGADAFRFDRRVLPDGSHRFQVLATDASGQQTISGEGTLKVDGTQPRVTLRKLRHRRLQVRIVDGKRGRSSGFRKKGSLISFGDGKRARSARAVHRYRRRGSFTVRVTAFDKAGNRARATKRVRFR